MFYWESIEMYRRILFVGVLPLLTEKSSRRAAFGVLFSIMSAICYRELEPFEQSFNNVLVHVAQ